jgi:hypothetical protein
MIIEFRRKELWLNLRCCPGVCLEGLRKIKSEKYPGADSSQAAPKCKLKALPPEAAFPLLVLYNLVNFSHSKFKCTTLCEVYKGVTLLSQR